MVDLQLFGSRLAWAACSPHCGASDPPNELFIGDARTGSFHLVAKSAFPQGNISWLGGSGNYLVWTDLSRTFTDDDESAIWQVDAINLSSGKVQTVASSGGRLAPGAPLFSVGADRVAWIEPTATQGGSRINVVDLDSGATSVLPAANDASAVALTGGYIVYDNAPQAAPADSQSSPSSVDTFYAVPVTGGSAKQLAVSTAATFPSIADGLVAWGSPRSGDATTVSVAPLDGHAPARVIYDGVNVQRSAGQGFVALWTNEPTLTVVPTAAGAAIASAVVVPGTTYVPAHFSVDGTRLAYATDVDPNIDTDLITLHVANVQ